MFDLFGHKKRLIEQLARELREEKQTNKDLIRINDRLRGINSDLVHDMEVAAKRIQDLTYQISRDNAHQDSQRKAGVISGGSTTARKPAVSPSNTSKTSTSDSRRHENDFAQFAAMTDDTPVRSSASCSPVSSNSHSSHSHHSSHTSDSGSYVSDTGGGGSGGCD